MATLFFTVFIVTFCWVELLYLALNRFGKVTAAGISALGVIAGFFYSYMGVADYVRDNQPVSLVAFSILAYLIPVVVLYFIALFTKHFSTNIKHFWAAGLGLINCFVWPFFALVLDCYTQLDCI
ncbi:hypothetical protein [Shewanella baltica]|uniref:hypothetical protein n=1 Tax=Shewanella baltica TaxID=62322 RepID=UPI0039B06617